MRLMLGGSSAAPGPMAMFRSLEDVSGDAGKRDHEGPFTLWHRVSRDRTHLERTRTFLNLLMRLATLSAPISYIVCVAPSLRRNRSVGAVDAGLRGEIWAVVWGISLGPNYRRRR